MHFHFRILADMIDESFTKINKARLVKKYLV